jgi:hypothetical protein
MFNPNLIGGFFDELEKISAQKKAPAAPPVSMAAKKANEVLFASDDERHPDNKLNKIVSQGSASAAGPDRSQAPVDGQSSANISEGNKMSPASGPGGV